ncbi:hypothetical protein JKP88DRAFT_246722 [Tribonema minus]|uniref:Uncharacterized protein n=1 Tax=Tribonema minus TaxID=303371 RepID=A0A836CCJ4_9STRA|nr:hypothetical protein JKP88DRAFT_246722 [Tribonema minus]
MNERRIQRAAHSTNGAFNERRIQRTAHSTSGAFNERRIQRAAHSTNGASNERRIQRTRSSSGAFSAPLHAHVTARSAAQAMDVLDLTGSDDDEGGGAGAYRFEPNGNHGVSSEDLKHLICPKWQCGQHNFSQVTSLGLDEIFGYGNVAPATQALTGNLSTDGWLKLPHFEEGTRTAEDYFKLIHKASYQMKERLRLTEVTNRYYGRNGLKPPATEGAKLKLVAVYKQRKQEYDAFMLRVHNKLQQQGYRTNGYSNMDERRIGEVTADLRRVFVVACADRHLFADEGFGRRLFADLVDFQFDARTTRAALAGPPAAARARLAVFLKQFIDAHRDIFELHADFEDSVALLKQDIHDRLSQEAEPEPEPELSEAVKESMRGKRRRMH